MISLIHPPRAGTTQRLRHRHRKARHDGAIGCTTGGPVQQPTAIDQGTLCPRSVLWASAWSSVVESKRTADALVGELMTQLRSQTSRLVRDGMRPAQKELQESAKLASRRGPAAVARPRPWRRCTTSSSSWTRQAGRERVDQDVADELSIAVARQHMERSLAGAVEEVVHPRQRWAESVDAALFLTHAGSSAVQLAFNSGSNAGLVGSRLPRSGRAIEPQIGGSLSHGEPIAQAVQPRTKRSAHARDDDLTADVIGTAFTAPATWQGQAIPPSGAGALPRAVASHLQAVLCSLRMKTVHRVGWATGARWRVSRSAASVTCGCSDRFICGRKAMIIIGPLKRRVRGSSR